MKFKNISILSVLLLFCFFADAVNIYAMNTGFSIEEVSDEIKRNCVRDNSVSVLAVEPEKASIECFDVNKQKRIAIGQNVSNQNRICVYDEEGTFLYGYSFSNSANNFNIEWDNENINVYMHNSRLLFSIDPQGNILEVKGVCKTVDNSIYSTSQLESRERNVDGITYKLKKSMGILNLVAASYSQVVAVNESGEESIVYDASSANFLRVILMVGWFVILGSIVISCIIREMKKQRDIYNGLQNAK